MERGKIFVPELPKNGLFYPYEYYKKGFLFASQGPGTVNDESINRNLLDKNKPVKLISLPQRIVIFDGHHRTSNGILYKLELPFAEIDNSDLNLPHVYPFYIFYREFIRRVGRIND